MNPFAGEIFLFAFFIGAIWICVFVDIMKKDIASAKAGLVVIYLGLAFIVYLWWFVAKGQS